MTPQYGEEQMVAAAAAFVAGEVEYAESTPALLPVSVLDRLIAHAAQGGRAA